MGDVSPQQYYDRQLRVPGWGEAGQVRLSAATALVVGVGGLGCPGLTSLARSGVGRLVFCDPDRVEASNLPRQTLFGTADIGHPKVTVAARELRRANPWITLEPRHERVEAFNVRALVEAADVVLDGTDNFSAKFLLHDACRSAGKDLVSGALYQWEAQVTAFAFSKREPGCWRCLHPQPPADGCVRGCAEVGVAGALASLAGHAQGLAAVRLLLGLEAVPARATWVFDAQTWESRVMRWKTDLNCDCQKGPGDWAWLEKLTSRSTPEGYWQEILPQDRRVIVDLRDTDEIPPGDWSFFRSQGSEVFHRPWSTWSHEQDWSPDTSYLLVCASGYRSLAALSTLPREISARSLRGGLATLRGLSFFPVGGSNGEARK